MREVPLFLQFVDFAFDSAEIEERPGPPRRTGERDMIDAAQFVHDARRFRCADLAVGAILQLGLVRSAMHSSCWTLTGGRFSQAA